MHILLTVGFRLPASGFWLPASGGRAPGRAAPRSPAARRRTGRPLPSSDVPRIGRCLSVSVGTVRLQVRAPHRCEGRYRRSLAMRPSALSTCGNRPFDLRNPTRPPAGRLSGVRDDRDGGGGMARDGLARDGVGDRPDADAECGTGRLPGGDLDGRHRRAGPGTCSRPACSGDGARRAPARRRRRRRRRERVPGNALAHAGPGLGGPHGGQAPVPARPQHHHQGDGPAPSSG